MRGQPDVNDGVPVDPEADARARRQPAPQRRHGTAVLVVAVGLGGVVGTLARYAVAQALPATGGQFPWATFIVNVSGSALLGFVLVVVIERFPQGHLARPLLASGFCGAYTTFSTLAVESIQLARHGHVALAGLDVGASVAAGLAAVWLGMLGARAAVRVERRLRRESA